MFCKVFWREQTKFYSKPVKSRMGSSEGCEDSRIGDTQKTQTNVKLVSAFTKISFVVWIAYLYQATFEFCKNLKTIQSLKNCCKYQFTS